MMARLLARKLNPRHLLRSTNGGSFDTILQSDSLRVRTLPNSREVPFEARHVSSLPLFFFRSQLLPSQPSLISNLDSFSSPNFSSRIIAIRTFSSVSPENRDDNDVRSTSEPPEFKHQEIEGPTVERDLSALANETREVLAGLQRSLYVLSSSLALLSFAHLVLGVSTIYAFQTSDRVGIQGVVAFGFPFSVAFLMRRAIRPMVFFQKMEENGRLQILTLALQVSKNLNLLFLRARVVSFSCVVAIALGSFVTLWPK